MRTKEKNIHFDVQIDEDVSYVSADVGMIERVLDNLIDNSLKHTPDNGTIGIHLSSVQGEIRVSVSDTGYGIAEDELPHIFKRFYRRSGASNEAGSRPGLGLGLAIASRIVELHGGCLSVDSVLHQGTTFRFSLQTNG